jgi:hypothetical protein
MGVPVNVRTKPHLITRRVQEISEALDLGWFANPDEYWESCRELARLHQIERAQIAQTEPV